MTGRANRSPVSSRALLGRLRRRLAKDGKSLHACWPDSVAFRELGHFYVVNEKDAVIRSNVDIEELGRELGVLRAFERLAEER